MIARRATLAAALLLPAAALHAPLRDTLKEHLRALAFMAAPRAEPDGPHPIGWRGLRLAAGGDTLAIDLWYPAAATGWSLPRLGHAALHPTRPGATPDAPLAEAGRPWPLILYHPAWFSHRADNSFLLAALASRGYIVAAFDDPVRNDGDALPDALRHATLDLSGDAALARSLGPAAARAEAAAALAARVPERLAELTGWGDRVASGRFGVLGFSFGGATAAAAAGQDPRVAAAVNLDGATFGAAHRDGVPCPYLTLFADPPFPDDAALSHPDPAIRLEAQLTREEASLCLARSDRPGQWSLVVPGAVHPDFCDRLLMPAFRDFGREPRAGRLARARGIHRAVAAVFEAALRDPGAAGPAAAAPEFPALGAVARPRSA